MSNATIRSGLLDLRLRRITWEAPGVLSLELVDPDGGALPVYEPGGHVDLHWADGLVRQYSLCGDPADRGVFRIGVREVEGGRFSRIVHRELRPGAMIRVGTPRNNFAFDAAGRYLFVAGGIGVTPLLPMMRAASAAGVPWTLLFCTRAAANVPFLQEARGLGGEVVVHATDAGTRLDVQPRLTAFEPGTLLYCCGPDRLMLAVGAATAHWPEGSVRFEWFTARARPADEISDTFELVCARSGTSLMVPPDHSVLDALERIGIAVPKSCEQGICGTCECTVLEGAVDHRDSILSESERAGGRTMMACVSRAAGPRLVLDL